METNGCRQCERAWSIKQYLDDNKPQGDQKPQGDVNPKSAAELVKMAQDAFLALLNATWDIQWHTGTLSVALNHDGTVVVAAPSFPQRPWPH